MQSALKVVSKTISMKFHDFFFFFTVRKKKVLVWRTNAVNCFLCSLLVTIFLCFYAENLLTANKWIKCCCFLKELFTFHILACVFALLLRWLELACHRMHVPLMLELTGFDRWETVDYFTAINSNVRVHYMSMTSWCRPHTRTISTIKLSSLRKERLQAKYLVNNFKYYQFL